MTLIVNVVLVVVSAAALAIFSYIRMHRGIEIPLWLALGWLVSFFAFLYAYFSLFKYFKYL